MERIKKLEKLLMYLIILIITICIPGIFLKISAIGLLSVIHNKVLEAIELHEIKQKLTNKELDYVINRLNSMQKIKKEQEEIFVEQYIPISEEYIEKCRNPLIYELLQETKIVKYPDSFHAFIDQLDKYDLCTVHEYLTKKLQATMEQEKRSLLNQRLTLVSFKLQDQFFKENEFTNQYPTAEQAFENINLQKLIAVRKRILDKEKKK